MGRDIELNKAEIITLLQTLDRKLENPVEIVVSGGAAVALTSQFDRGTYDIDVIEVKPDFDAIKTAVTEMSSDLNMKETWMNDEAKKFNNNLPEDFRERLVLLDGAFEYLKVYSLGKPDLAIQKILAMRDKDYHDLQNLQLNRQDIKIIERHKNDLEHDKPEESILLRDYLEAKKNE